MANSITNINKAVKRNQRIVVIESLIAKLSNDELVEIGDAMSKRYSIAKLEQSLNRINALLCKSTLKVLENSSRGRGRPPKEKPHTPCLRLVKS